MEVRTYRYIIYIHIYEQALVCLSNREIVGASTWCTFYCNMANNRLITLFSIIVLA